MFISGYKFDSKLMADQAMNYLNTHHGLPTKNGVTKFSEVSYTQHAEGFYCIAFDTEWTSPLGEPVEIEINNLP
jgi:hypothetical protein